ncbi:GNAT family N-acetyltransferase [Undibacterium parvum]|uniref:GNAT family N-acetyltransferase n=2 Tax=Undibacterium TaxID=401469 RepID=A0A6M4A181_9BURK|nr:GNAT family N-acetyltransferase [Undibacterium parvum]AZP14166.1 GNAT family N-acetyltransferase [Undibacterium parvum]QJQ05092.1 GNAT family N-acetyltransferase [Undibacterium piscinae]
MNILIKPCTPEDGAALALIGQATFLETFAGIIAGHAILKHCAQTHSPAQYQEWLNDPQYQLWLAELAPGAAPIGYILVAPAQLPLAGISAADLEIKRIYLLSKFHGGGLGKRMLEHAINYAKQRQAARLLLGVYAKNSAAIGFYQHAGFQQVGTRSFTVGGIDFDDYIMALAL